MCTSHICTLQRSLYWQDCSFLKYRMTCFFIQNMVHQGDCVSGTSSHSVDVVNLWFFQYSLLLRVMFQFYQQVPNVTRIFFINNSNDVPCFSIQQKNLVSISHLLQGQGAIKDPILLDLCVLTPFIVKVHKKGVWVQYISTKRSTNHNISTGNVCFFKGLHNQTSGILSEFRTYILVLQNPSVLES